MLLREAGIYLRANARCWNFFGLAFSANAVRRKLASCQSSVYL